MENQHRKITGYRELSQEEIDLMNLIKAKGSEILELQRELANVLRRQSQEKSCQGEISQEGAAELKRFIDAEPLKWADIGKTNIQTGIMALVRAIAQPDI